MPPDDEKILRMIRLAICSCRAFLRIPEFASGNLHKNPGFIPLGERAVFVESVTSLKRRLCVLPPRLISTAVFRHRLPP